MHGHRQKASNYAANLAENLSAEARVAKGGSSCMRNSLLTVSNWQQLIPLQLQIHVHTKGRRKPEKQI